MNSISANRLARICAYSTDGPEWDEFLHEVMPAVSLAVLRVAGSWGDCSHGTRMEIVQEVLLKLCEDERKILRDFEDRGNDSFLKFLRVISASVATDYFRRMKAEKRGGRVHSQPLETHLQIEEIADGGAVHAVEWPTLVSQLNDLLSLYPETVSERDRALFWLYYRHGWTADSISRIPAMGLGRKGVESALFRLNRLLQRTIREGKPRAKVLKEKPVKTSPAKGFSGAVAIDSVKRIR